jgi:ubiquinone/menaquinone biosynthesis C-methylase UbiE/DNA-binding transcriptional ArsR family regulator
MSVPAEEPSIAFDALLDALRAAGEPTRLRILALLAESALTVSDLTEILRQSQPRVSRHLKLLVDAGLIERSAEGSWAFFQLATGDPRAEVARQALRSLAGADPTLNSDSERLGKIRSVRAAAAQRYFALRAREWDDVRQLHIADDRVERSIIEALADRPYRSMLDVGTGTGRMLEVFGPRIERGLGVDLSPQMLALARNKLEGAGLSHCRVRQADLYALGLPRDSFDVAVIHQVLHVLDDPAAAISEAASTLVPGGRLVVVDFAPHSREVLRIEHAHRRLGFNADTVTEWMSNAGLDVTLVDTLLPESGSDKIAITVWVGADARAFVPAAPAAHQPVEEMV